ncbi:hypothetical protein TTHERM_000390049 (macronuclear) [Tetrahymena thermophila SB210]|uniref:Cyclic nucleotide-binding domain-containing protein n=1 Tax=Tetrahymena thermophila (strain SB210) TaxID=312017 RepID=W7XIS8_TETTS|nr:hypothetical protein TTHERM_000390049 [Tetrahymena thermophila SB210]EWS73579.1 hypothetical protein TTHERM_000390049 [Tetrahymena thermophila SB210]|eukprot:XP_012653902.1 hypothetical protein TTHERM_000390049 [Tetrahymena thermophila SB210]
MPNQKDYKLAQETDQERRLIKKCNKLRRYKLFQDCFNDQLKLLLKNISKFSLVKKQHLYLEGDSSEYVYLFQKGQITLKKNIIVNELELDDPWRENQKLLASRAFQQKNIELAEMNPYDILGIDEIFNSQQMDLERQFYENQNLQNLEGISEDNNNEKPNIIHNRYLSIVVSSDSATFKSIKKDFFLTFAQNNNLIKELYKRSEENQIWINQLVKNFQKVYSLKKQYMIQLKQGDRDLQLVHIENHLVEKQKKENDKQIFFLVRPEIQMYQRIKRVRAKSESESDKRLQKKYDELSKPVSIKQNSELHQKLIKLFTKKKKDANEKELRVNLYVNSSVKFYKDRDDQRRQTKYQSTGTFKNSHTLTPKKMTPTNKIKNSGMKTLKQFYSQFDQQHITENSFSQNCQNANTSRNNDNSLIQMYKNQERAYTPSLNGRLNLSTNKSPNHAQRPSSNMGKSQSHNTEYILCSDLIKEDQRFSTNLQQFEQLVRGSISCRKIDESDEDFTSALTKNDFSGNKNSKFSPNKSNSNLDIKSLLRNKKIKNILSQIYDTSSIYSKQQTEGNLTQLPAQINNITHHQLNSGIDGLNTRQYRTKSMNTDVIEINQKYNGDKNHFPPVSSVTEELQSSKLSSQIYNQSQNQKKNQVDKYIKISSQNLKIPLVSYDVEKKIEIKMRSQLIMKQLDIIKQKAMKEKRTNRSKDVVFNSISVTDIQKSIRDDSLERNQKMQSNLDKLLNYFDQQQLKQTRYQVDKSNQKHQEYQSVNNLSKECHEIQQSAKLPSENALRNSLKEQILIQPQSQLKIIEKFYPLNPMIPLTKFKQKQKHKEQPFSKS